MHCLVSGSIWNSSRRILPAPFISVELAGPRLGTLWAAYWKPAGQKLPEYYFNDHGGQIDRFARSLVAAAEGEPTPEDGYGGDYIREIASAVVEKNPAALDGEPAEVQENFRALGVEMMFEQIKASLREFGVEFDVYFHENSLYESGAVEKQLPR